MVWHTSQSEEKYALRILESFNELKEKNILFDCAVKVGEKEIPAHSLLLAANSESLRQEILDGKKKIVFEDVKPEAVDQCMDLMYGQHGEELEDNMEDILRVSSKIKFEGVTDLCFDYMEENLTVQNCFTIIERAKSHGRNKVVAFVEKFIGENLKAFIETEKFILLSKVDLLHYIEISNAECQIVWRAVSKWIEGKEEDGLLLELMNAVNIKEFPIEYLIQTVWKDAKAQDSARVMVIQCVFSDLERLKRDINLDNYFLIKSFNESRNTFNKCDVKGIVESFMAEQFSQIKDKDDFMLLKSEDLIGILRDAKLAPVTEKWEAVVKWTKHDISRAGYYFIQLVEMIDVEVFTFNQLLDIVWEELLTQKSETVKEFVARIIFSKRRELEEQVSIANCFHLMDVNIKYNSINCEEIDVFLKNFLVKNFGEVAQKEEFLLLPRDDVLHILKIAETNGVANWQAMVRWMKFDASREDHLLEMIEVVDFEDLTVAFLLQIVYNEPLVQKSEVAKIRAVENLFSDFCRLEKSINEDNCLDLKQLVDESSKHDDARKVVNRYMMLNLERVGLKRGFLDLSFNGLVSLLQTPEAVIQSDATKWEHVLKWVKHEETRDADLSALIKVLKIQDCSFLLETMWKESVVQSSEEAKSLVLSGLFSYVKNLRANTDDSALERIVKTFLANNLSQLRDEDEIMLLKFEKLLYILRNSKLAPVTEKWETAVKWMKHDLSRDGCFIQLVEAIGVESFTYVQLLDVVWEESLTQKSEKAKEFVAKILFSKEREFEKNISITNCFLLMDSNMKYNSANRNETAVILQNFLTVNFGEISKNEKFLLLSIKDVMNSLKIAELEEMTKWEAMIRWMKYDASREDHLLEMMEVVDFEDFTVDFLLQIVHNESLVQKFEVAKMQIVENLFSDLHRLERGIDENNCLGLKHIVDESLVERHDDARMVVNRYVMLNLECVCSKQGFLDLNFNGLVALLQAPEAVIQSDATKWENVLKWVKHEETRNTHLPKLMEILKIKNFFLLFETVWRENLVQSSAETKILLINGLFSDLETLRENIDANNCFHLRELNACDHVNKDEVEKLLSHFMMQHFEEIMGREDFLNLSEDDLAMFLESPDTKISSEEAKWKAMVKWVKHDKQREAVFSRLFKLLDLKRIDEEYLSSFVLNEPLVKESQEFVSRMFHRLEDPPRCVAILCQHTSELIILNVEDGSRHSVSISENHSLGIVTIDREVYAVTMEEILQIHKDGTRIVLQQLQNVERWSKVVLLQKKIYIIQPDEGSMLCFDPADKSFIDNLPGYGLGYGFCAAADDDFIYAMGGLLTETSARRFDPITRTWSEIPTMRKKRDDAAAAVLEGKIYVMGGINGNDSVECFDPESNSWTEVASMNKPRIFFSAVVIDNRLHAVGGNRTRKEDSIEVYDKQLNHWVIAEKFETRDLKHGTSACSWPHGSFKPDTTGTDCPSGVGAVKDASTESESTDSESTESESTESESTESESTETDVEQDVAEDCVMTDDRIEASGEVAHHSTDDLAPTTDRTLVKEPSTERSTQLKGVVSKSERKREVAHRSTDNRAPTTGRTLVKEPSSERRTELKDEFHLQLAEEIEHRIKTKSTKSKIVAPEGGFLDNIGCKVTYPPKTFNKDTKVETSVITDFSDCPDQRIPIAPIIQCSPSGRLNQPAFLELDTWAYPTRDDVPVYAEVFQKDEEDSEWIFFKEVRIEGNGKISFYAEHFSWFEVVVDYAKWFWSGLTRPIRPLLQIALQNLVYISEIHQSIACICCLKSDKIRRDVTQALRDDGFHTLLPRPVNTHAFRSEEVKVAISCLQPGNLEILPGNNGGDNAGGERRVEKGFSVDDVYKRCEKFHYLPIALRGEDLTTYKGRLRFLYSLAAEDDNVEHPMQTVWPIPGSAPTHVTNIQRTANFYGRTPINTLLAPDPRENQ